MTRSHSGCFGLGAAGETAAAGRLRMDLSTGSLAEPVGSGLGTVAVAALEKCTLDWMATGSMNCFSQLKRRSAYAWRALSSASLRRKDADMAAASSMYRRALRVLPHRPRSRHLSKDPSLRKSHVAPPRRRE